MTKAFGMKPTPMAWSETIPALQQGTVAGVDVDIHSAVSANLHEVAPHLVLSGHSHGGQRIPLVQLIRWFHLHGDDAVYGQERRGDTDFLVTSGISDWAILFKTGCRSEYVIIEIQGT